ncbi:MAG: hypothetical protein JXQ69_08100 [Paludibacteraceae bacterium]|nr:hypothetical protein [Paludibacteraceae bacterium]
MKKANWYFYLCSVIILFAFSCNNKPIKDNNLQGMKEDEILKLYGKPNSTLTFILSDSKLYEYRYNLANLIPQYKNESIQIKELLWINGNNKTVIWLFQKEGKWVVVDNLKWGKGIQF